MTSLLTKLHDYKAKYVEGMNALNSYNLNMAIEMIKVSDRIYVGGNGGSAAISNHLCCDFMKGADLNVSSVSCNTPLITAIANDMGYERTLSFQLNKLVRQGDIVILVSSSGNSQNIIEAANVVKSRRGQLIGLTGFAGGALKELSDISLHIPIHNYGVVEDCHQSIMHIISQFIAEEKGDQVVRL